jgi:hypothetical protein
MIGCPFVDAVLLKRAAVVRNSFVRRPLAA